MAEINKILRLCTSCLMSLLISSSNGKQIKFIEEDFDKMINVSLGMKPLWENALGKDWEKIMTREKLRELYGKL